MYMVKDKFPFFSDIQKRFDDLLYNKKFDNSKYRHL